LSGLNSSSEAEGVAQHYRSFGSFMFSSILKEPLVPSGETTKELGPAM